MIKIWHWLFKRPSNLKASINSQERFGPNAAHTDQCLWNGGRLLDRIECNCCDHTSTYLKKQE
ncbi:hypothetical protein LLH06_19305 [Mucilaginibacter daejeonensis]|uniref:hypothetical protein n=1 Tax=Mucilaginibacter daejeonensis TaxID=398049 RepID=UPI001D173343|nr:hypothetical protein [Mucilaginibacter daejeonensis]UEG53095.1 hypothetical protein LLH06_19305 [Mucilaginibacter daejeonensis]